MKKTQLQNFIHPQWGSIIGHEADIRLAVLKDEVELWQKRVGDDLDSIPYSVIIRNTLKSRIKELEKSAILIKERDKL